ncbi:CLUMA_CG002139, isoform A [Clunio marinus]|uniref:Regucalcin n=1 Tax=Clunio marinus TaxID=568069 RepID=A0A1J1HLE1_9DIPT|nr:CLUMA_CG002139, isoform A [Clunio marinus]
MSSYKVEVVESSPVSVLGEGPHWDVERQSLYYNDIYGDKQSISRYDYNEEKTYNALIPGHPVISFIIPVDGTKDQFIVGSGKKIVLIQWDGKSVEAKAVKTIGEVESDMPENRFNDAKCDAFGRFYGGTMRIELEHDIFEKRLGTFYRYTNKEKFVPLKNQIGVSNGLTWNKEANKFYYIDSCDLDVKEFDFDSKTGNISNERVVIDFTVNGNRPNFVPDGMTIDTNGSLYVATFGASKIYKINPTTCAIELEINFPAEQITSAAFGGPNLDILYVTTSGKEFKSKQPPPAGRLFRVTGLGVKGFPMTSVKLN